MRISWNHLGALSLVLCVIPVAAAQASRTWVSGVGDDANPCSRTAPCKTFAGAISKTAAGGEIDALDPAGFGAVTITKAVTIDGGGGQVASVLVAGTNGIVVQAGVGDVVILRNLDINGLAGAGNGGINGIRYLSGAALRVEHCRIFGFTQSGIDVNMSSSGKLTVDDTIVSDSGSSGISVLTTIPNAVSGSLHNTRILNSVIGVSAQAGSYLALRDCVISQNTTAGIQQSNLGGGSSLITIVASTLASDNIAVQSAAGALVLASGNSFVLNSTIFNENGGLIFTGGDNVNSSNGAVGANHGAIPKV